MTKNISILSKQDLISYFEKGCKPIVDFRIGVEHEKFIFDKTTLKRIPYAGHNGIKGLLEAFTSFGWQIVFEGDFPIALIRGQSSITLEPGGQFELSGTPLQTLHESSSEIRNHIYELNSIASQMGLFSLGLGFDPLWSQNEIPWMPKERYALMRHYMPRKGSLGLDMMTRTSTIQVNLDYASEEDMCKKFRVGLALQPIATALFANSILVERVLTPYQSYRSYVWQHTDPDRTGALNFVFDPGMGFERYVDYLLDVPMYFVYRNHHHINTLGLSFRDFMHGNLPGLKGEFPTLKDWENHASTVFPDVRLKHFLEMRGADSGSKMMTEALPAFWVGLLYDDNSLTAAYELAISFTPDEYHFLSQETPKKGLHTPFRTGTIRDLAHICLEISKNGLIKRNLKNEAGQDESLYLDVLFEIVQKNQSQADLISERWKRLKNSNAQDDYIRSLAY